MSLFSSPPCAQIRRPDRPDLFRKCQTPEYLKPPRSQFPQAATKCLPVSVPRAATNCVPVSVPMRRLAAPWFPSRKRQQDASRFPSPTITISSGMAFSVVSIAPAAINDGVAVGTWGLGSVRKRLLVSAQLTHPITQGHHSISADGPASAECFTLTT